MVLLLIRQAINKIRFLSELLKVYKLNDYKSKKIISLGHSYHYNSFFNQF